MAMGVPAGYHSVQPYLIFDGCLAAIAFYKKAFGATERLCIKGPDGRVGHAEIELGDSCVMMADENPVHAAYAPQHFGGSPISLMFYTEDCDATYAKAVSEGATSLREPADQPHGARMAGVKDPFGYTWYIATHQKDMTKEELEALV